MRLRALLIASLVSAGMLLGGCGHKDAAQCDFYQGLSVNWVHIQGYVPSDVQDSIAEYC